MWLCSSEIASPWSMLRKSQSFGRGEFYFNKARKRPVIWERRCHAMTNMNFSFLNSNIMAVEMQRFISVTSAGGRPLIEVAEASISTHGD
jgi:hypothetical protein